MRTGVEKELAAVMAAALVAGGPLAAQPTIELSDESLLAANTATSPARTASTLAEIELPTPFTATIASEESGPVAAALQAYLSDPGPAAARALRRALDGDEPGALTARAWFELARASARAADLDALYRDGTRAQAHAEAIGNNEAVANARVLQGLAFLFADEGHPSAEYLERAMEHFTAAATSVDAADGPFGAAPVVWTAHAWQLIAYRTAEKLGHDDSAKRMAPALRTVREHLGLGPSNASCGLKWRKTGKLAYDKKAFESDAVGAVVLGFDLTKRLKPANAEVLAAVPNGMFADSALKALRGSRLSQADGPRAGDPACLEGRVTTIHIGRGGGF